MFVDKIVNILTEKHEDIEIAIEILLFISYITNQDQNMKIILEKNIGFFIILKKIINSNSVKYF